MSKRRSWQPALGLLIGFAAVAGVVASTQNHPAHQPLEATLAPRSPSRSTGEGLTLAQPFLHACDSLPGPVCRIFLSNILLRLVLDVGQDTGQYLARRALEKDPDRHVDLARE